MRRCAEVSITFCNIEMLIAYNRRETFAWVKFATVPDWAKKKKNKKKQKKKKWKIK